MCNLCGLNAIFWLFLCVNNEKSRKRVIYAVTPEGLEQNYFPVCGIIKTNISQNFGQIFGQKPASMLGK